MSQFSLHWLSVSKRLSLPNFPLYMNSRHFLEALSQWYFFTALMQRPGWLRKRQYIGTACGRPAVDEQGHDQSLTDVQNTGAISRGARLALVAPRRGEE